jgi:hypothetical protein
MVWFSDLVGPILIAVRAKLALQNPNVKVGVILVDLAATLAIATAAKDCKVQDSWHVRTFVLHIDGGGADVSCAFSRRVDMFVHLMAYR